MKQNRKKMVKSSMQIKQKNKQKNKNEVQRVLSRRQASQTNYERFTFVTKSVPVLKNQHFVNPFQPSVEFQMETSHLIYCANQMVFST